MLHIVSLSLCPGSQTQSSGHCHSNQLHHRLCLSRGFQSRRQHRWKTFDLVAARFRPSGSDAASKCHPEASLFVYLFWSLPSWKGTDQNCLSAPRCGYWRIRSPGWQHCKLAFSFCCRGAGEHVCGKLLRFPRSGVRLSPRSPCSSWQISSQSNQLWPRRIPSRRCRVSDSWWSYPFRQALWSNLRSNFRCHRREPCLSYPCLYQSSKAWAPLNSPTSLAHYKLWSSSCKSSTFASLWSLQFSVLSCRSWRHLEWAIWFLSAWLHPK